MDEEQLFGSGDSSSDNEEHDNVEQNIYEEESSEDNNAADDSPSIGEAEESSDSGAGGDAPDNIGMNPESGSEDDDYDANKINEENNSESDEDVKQFDHEIDDSDNEIDDSHDKVNDSDHEVDDSDHEVDDSNHEVDDSDHEVDGSDPEVDSVAQGDVTPVQDSSEDEDHVSADEDESKFQEPEQEESDQDNNLAITYAESDKSSEHENEEHRSATEATDSDEDENNQMRKAKNVLNTSSSDEEDQGTEKVDNLFGDADDISSSDDNEDAEDDNDVDDDDDDDDDDEKQVRHVVTDDEEKDEEEAHGEPEKDVMETRIEVEIPKIKTDLGSAIHFVRFPNFISAEPRPFDPAVYEDEIEEDELLDEEGRTRLKLKVENTIRWRKFTDENGIDLTESNARIVRWSDGSLSLHLGSEIFDVHQMSLQGDHNHLFIRQGTGLQGQAVFSTKLAFRPHSTKSATHKKMTNRLAMRHNQNQQKVRVLPIAGQDPESRKAALMKEEEEQLKAHVRREAQKRRMRERSHTRGPTANYLNHRYDDGTTNDDDDEGISVAAIKNRFKSGPSGLGGSRKERIYSSDSDSEGEKRLMNAKRLSSDDDDDVDIGAKRRREDDGELRRKTYVVSDDEDEDAAMMST